MTVQVSQRLLRPGRAAEIWEQRQSTFTSQVLGPHFEHVCREWAREFAEPATFRAQTNAEVGQGVLHAGRDASYEIDVAVFGSGGKHRQLLSVGEVKWGAELSGRCRVMGNVRCPEDPGHGPTRV